MARSPRPERLVDLPRRTPAGERVELPPAVEDPNLSWWVPPLSSHVRPTPDDVARWIEDLRDDDVRGNRSAAAGHLHRNAHTARAALVEALGSDDAQQRHSAARILSLHLEHEGIEPPDALLAVAAEGLADDRERAAEHPFVTNGPLGVTTLCRGGARAWRFVEGGLVSLDPQERLLAAVVLAKTDYPYRNAHLVDVLVENLRDDDVRANAMLARVALHALGERARPALDAECLRGDAQSRGYAGDLLARLDAGGELHLGALYGLVDAVEDSWPREP